MHAQANSQNKTSVTLTIPQWVLAAAKVVDYGVAKVSETVQDAAEVVSKKSKFSFNLNMRDRSGNIMKKISSPFKSKKLAIFVLVLIIGGLTFWGINRSRANSGQAVIGAQTAVDPAKQVSVNKSFNIAIKNAQGEETGQQIKVTVTTVEKTDNILIQNKPAKTKNGKTFLVINMEIQNDTKTELKVKPVDMIRLVGTDGKTYAADVYNTDVSAKALSIQKTRVGYVVELSQKTFRLLIGEVRGTQEPIDVNF